MADQKRFPYMKWYARDWRGDGALRGCSFAARGLWADILTIMHDEGEPYGYLRINGSDPDSVKLGRMLGGTPREIEKLLSELEAAGVFSRTNDGTVFSRRMVRDKAKAETDRENGKGGGNPKLKTADNGGVNPEDKAQNPEPYSNSNKPEERKKAFEGFVVGKGGGRIPMTDENKLALFQKWLATAIGPDGWKIVGEAANPDSPNYETALSFCKQRAREGGKGWPHKWPKREAA